MSRSTKASWLESKGDLKTREVTDVPEEGSSVLVRGLPAAYANQATSDAVEMKQLPNGDQISSVNTRLLECLKFLHGVLEPKFDSLEEVEQVAEHFGPAWRKVIEEIDKLSGLDAESQEAARAKFPGGRGSSNGVHLEGGSPAGRAGSDVPARAGAGDGDAG
jgi:hypothetical protein